MNAQPKINKLLTALRMKGIVYKVNTQQYFSEKQERICTKFILWEDSPKNGEVFYSKAKMLKYLAERWKEVMDHGEAEDGRTGRADE